MKPTTIADVISLFNASLMTKEEARIALGLDQVAGTVAPTDTVTPVVPDARASDATSAYYWGK